MRGPEMQSRKDSALKLAKRLRAEFFDSLVQFRKLASEAGLREEDWEDNEVLRRKLYAKFSTKIKAI